MIRFAVVMAALVATTALAQDKPAAAPVPGPAAGTIDFVEGDAMVENGAAARIAKEGDEVHVGETITTFPKAELQLKMADGAYYSLREYSKKTITKYAANGDEHDEGLIDLARGALRSITGWIGKYRREAYGIRTPMVTIGVRGTDHEVTHLLPGDPRGEPGTYDKVNEGATVMQSPAGGRVEVQPNRAGYFNAARPGAPRLLASVPKFFQPARHEDRFVERAHASVRTIDAQRDLRRKAHGLPPGQRPQAAVPERKLERRAAESHAQTRAPQRKAERTPQRKVERQTREKPRAEPRRMEQPRRTPRRFEKK